MDARAYWIGEYLRKARFYRSRARHELRIGNRFAHRWNMEDAIHYVKEAKKIKAGA